MSKLRFSSKGSPARLIAAFVMIASCVVLTTRLSGAVIDEMEGQPMSDQQAAQLQVNDSSDPLPPTSVGTSESLQPPTTTPSDEDIAREAAFRAELGLSSSISYVEGLYAAYRAGALTDSSYKYAALFTSTEVAEVDRRV